MCVGRRIGGRRRSVISSVKISDASQRVMDRRSFPARSSGSGGFFSTGRLMDTWIFFLFVAIAGKSCTLLLAIPFHTRCFSPFSSLPTRRESLRGKPSFPPPSLYLLCANCPKTSRHLNNLFYDRLTLVWYIYFLNSKR